jgi:endonuclease/exonuclease/phosphatase family metal-dependent hydrolase
MAGETAGVMMRFATWNLRYSGKAHSLMRLNFLKSIEWDVIALQEVSRTAWKAFVKEGLVESGFYTLEGFGLTPKGKRPYGVALLARNGFTLAEPELVPGLPIAERGLAAKVQGPVTPIAVASWHAPNTAGAGAKVKMQGYQGIIDWLGNVAGPLILGFDGNHWNRSTSLELEVVMDSNNPWYLENRFFGADPPHRLRDTLIDYYKKDAEAYRAVKESRTDDEPLAVSYVRGSKKWPVEDRFDYVFVSDEIDVLHCHYDYDGARAARSDHGIVVADLRIKL